MWMLVAFLLQVTVSPCASAPPTRTDPPRVVLQTVDPGWLPLPGVEVRLKPKKGKPEVALASNDGQARFWVPRDADYSIEVKLTGFKTVRIKTAHLGSGSSFSTRRPSTSSSRSVSRSGKADVRALFELRDRAHATRNRASVLFAAVTASPNSTDRRRQTTHNVSKRGEVAFVVRLRRAAERVAGRPVSSQPCQLTRRSSRDGSLRRAA
jgi:hypothetical protein